jgi:hypothetical protein
MFMLKTCGIYITDSCIPVEVEDPILLSIDPVIVHWSI